jgi:hypothetical protein
MTDPVKFAADVTDFNNRVATIERHLAALEQERKNLLITSRDHGVMVGAARRMLAKIAYDITFPEAFRPSGAVEPGPQAEPAGPAIVRHDAAE